MPGKITSSRDSSDYDDQKAVEYSREGNNKCFTCGKLGHWARECPDGDEREYYNNPRRRGGYQGRGGWGGRGRGGYGGRPRNSDICYKCGQQGHYARECESEGYERRPMNHRNDYCFRCGQAGHMARECSANNNACYNCHKEGHLARDCPEDNECYRCGKTGHLARRCIEDLERNGETRGTRRDMMAKECYICRSTDHIQAKCPEAVCYRCHKEGHIARDCPSGDECYNCGEIGHMARDCHERRGEVSNDEVEGDNGGEEAEYEEKEDA